MSRQPTLRKAVDFDRSTALYRLYDMRGTLLYIGIAFEPEIRWRQHASDKRWWPRVSRKTVEWHPNRPAALEAEVAAIRSEDPWYNQRDHDVPASAYIPGARNSRGPSAVESDPEILRERERIGDRVRSLRLERDLTQDQLGELSGLDRKTINRIEQARYPSVVDRFIRVARGLGVSVASLLADDCASTGWRGGGGSRGGERS